MTDSVTIPFKNEGIQSAIEEARAYKKSLEDIGKSANASSAEVSAAFRQIQQQSQTGKDALLKVIGGDALPEQAKKITESLSAASSSGLSFTTRIAALAGGVGLAIPALGILATTVGSVLNHFGATGAIEGFADRLRSAIIGSETHAEVLVRETNALVQLQMATARAAVETQKQNDALGALKDRTDDYAEFILHGAMDQAWKAAGIADRDAIEQLQDLHARHLEAAVGADLLAEAERHGAEATQRQAEAVMILRGALQDAAKAQGDLSYAVRQGESAADRIMRIFTGTRLRAEQVILENRERRQIGRAERQALRSQGYSAREVDEALGSLGYSAPSGGNNSALVQAKEGAAAVIAQLRAMGVEFEETRRKAHQSAAAYFNTLRTEAQAALDAERKRIELLNAEHELEKQLLLDVERKQRELVDSNRELEKRGSLIRQQFQDTMRNPGQQLQLAQLQLSAQNSLGLNGLTPGRDDRTTQRQSILDQIGQLGDKAAANAGDDQVVQQLNAQAQALSNVVTQYDALARSQREAQDVGLQFTQAFRQNSDITMTGAQSLAQTFSGAFSEMTGALRAHLKAAIAGKEEWGAALSAMLSETLLNLGTESIVQGLFQLAQGFAALATYRPAEAASHFTAAGIYAAVAAASIGGYAALSAATPQASQAASSPAKGYSDKPANVPAANSSEERGNLTINLNGTLIGANDEIGKVIAYHVNRQSRFGNIRIRN